MQGTSEIRATMTRFLLAFLGGFALQTAYPVTTTQQRNENERMQHKASLISPFNRVDDWELPHSRSSLSLPRSESTKNVDHKRQVSFLFLAL